MIEIKPRFKIQYPMKNQDKNSGDLCVIQYSFPSIKNPSRQAGGSSFFW